ncbi:DNA polymerase III subunit alpha [Tychonema sp. LEGE 07199]|uniref:DNA polymerase III subunit alpha n=1 Tax=unclassified Tychonema TaxID=2642144 RepID=UPI00187FC5FB|nr:MULTISPECIES: DNA polymerase III subunit alpha [unclassified Tychonema]MBE9123184.1 DNA polymerase III subunit alpha [Tychonema sp. LEGE 07199]MBE9134553.1 DNA polymerase III subunit alpha [Tychonema sp. LEGE 07196]
MSFVGLHIHSDYSLLDGASQLQQLAERAVELGMPAIALTDHGVMYGAIELIKVCRNKNIKPIIGNEMYVVNGDIEVKVRGRRKYHQVVLAKNTQGYKNLVKLTTISHLKGMPERGIFARPCINKDLLKQYSEGLIVTSACLGGEVPQMILQNKLDTAREVAKWYKEVFGDDYYIEIQDHGSQEDRMVNVEIVKIAREFNIKIIATNDSHYISCNDVEAHDALLCINTNKLIEEDKRMRYSGTEYLKSADEMAQLFRDHLDDETIKEAIETTLEVANKVSRYELTGEARIPTIPIPPEHTADTYVEEISWLGLLERLKSRTRNEIPPVYKQRLEYELKMIQQMGFSEYFLVVWDYMKYARDNNIPVGPGRGSAAGSLVAYVLNITNIDPVHHGLLFERFLNPERKSMPDIDSDFCIERRDDMIKYVTEKYGTDRVAQIITFNRMTSKAVLKDVARVLGIPYKKADEMAKMIPVSRGKPEKLKVMISEGTPAQDFKDNYENTICINAETGTEVPVRQWIDMAIRIEGTNKTYGVHAAGVVISSQPLDEIVPLQKNDNGAVITQYFMEDLEFLGLLKMDFLGLKNLTTLQKTVEYVKQTQDITIDAEALPSDIERRAQETFTRNNKLPGDVAKTYQLLEKGDLEGIFQLESSGMLDVVKKIKPSCLDDISSILALYRPGPLDAGLIPQFIDRKHGREVVKYDHPLLEPILKETYGTLCFQEQIMRMAQDLAGYSLGQADLLRRAMGKKKADEMQKQKETFIDGATKNGVTQRVAEELFGQMLQFAEYCFNKSHSMAYAYITYQTAYLKANFPVEYMAALLTANSGDQEKVQRYIANCLKLKIDVEPPDINSSELIFTPLPIEMTKAERHKILFGISAVKNVGEGAIENILEARQEGGHFKSLPDLCDRVNLHSVNRRALEALIQCGAFDKIDPNRQQLVNDLEGVMKWAQDRKKDRESGQGNLFDLLGGNSFGNSANKFESAPKSKTVKDFDTQEKLRLEKELLGFYVSEHPLKFLLESNQDPDVVTLAQLAEKKGKVSVIVTISAIKLVVTKKGDAMAILQLEDLTNQIKAVVFPKAYEQVKPYIVDNAILLIGGKIEKDGEEIQIIVDTAKPVENSQVAEEIEVAQPEIQNSWARESETQSSWAAQPERQNYLATEPVNFARSTKPVEVIEMVIVKFTPQQVQDAEKLNSLKALLEELSDRREDARASVGGIVVGKYCCQPLRINPKLWVQDGDGAVSRLKSAGFDAWVFPLDNRGDAAVFREVRSQVNIHSWASRLLDADVDRISQYLNYLAQLNKRPPN